MKRLLMATLILLAPGTSRAAWIGLYADPNCAVCSVTLAQGATTTLYVCASTSRSIDFGDPCYGGQFRVIGLPPGWDAVVVPDTGLSLAQGDMFGDGVSFSFPTFVQNVVHLFTVSVHASTSAQNARLQVVAPVHPTPPLGHPTTCPWLEYSLVGTHFGACVEGLTFAINGTCVIGLEPTTWSNVRAMYR